VINLKSKKNFKKIVQMAIPLLILLGISLLEVNINELREEAINPKKPISSGYWEVDEYTISGNGGWETTNSTYDWCNGSGTWENPYIIENVTFRCLDGDGDSLRIESSDVYFIIRNCTFTSSGSHTYDAGIHLYQVGNGTLINNNCSFNNNYGIYINYSDNNTISGNTVNNNDLGIYLGDSDNNNVSGNTANHNSNYYGIYLYYSNSNTVSGNTANYNDYGIFLLHSDSNTVSGNIFDNNVDCGIYIGISDYNLIYKNYFINNGKHALDEGYSNDWNSSIIGNYWDNYMGYDDDLDGIGDTPHNFGTGIDNLPIWNFQSPIHIDDSPPIRNRRFKYHRKRSRKRYND
jgi:parallel beta-helix repeat protein